MLHVKEAGSVDESGFRKYDGSEEIAWEDFVPSMRVVRMVEPA